MSLKSRQKCFGILIISTVLLALLGGFFSQAYAVLPDTGQTKCYNDTAEIPCPSPGQDYYGQDGNYTINPPSYTKLDANGNALPDSATSWAMVKDNVTGLIWENKTTDGSIHDSGKKYNWADAQNVFIAQLNSSKFGGYSDWRMPIRDELRLIANFSRVDPAINVGYFPNTNSTHYWSSSPLSSSTDYAYTVNFWYGSAVFSDKSLITYVRAVRGVSSVIAGNFVNNNNGTVSDTGTGLMWQQATGNNGQKVATWKEALAYCENLSLAGYTDWRLPNIRELALLADLSRVNPGINIGYFSDTISDRYWSSSIFTFYIVQVWDVGFFNGNELQTLKSNSDYVRCVRGGQPQTVIDKGNVNGDDKVDLADAILALRALAGITVSQTFNLNADVNGDKKIGIEEVIYILQTVAGLRP